MAETEPLPRKPHHPAPNPNPTKYFTRFLYKSTFVLLFLVIIPLFPSQAPEFINQSFPTRSWELLHLIFVGIAVSYGLFSRRNDEDASDKADAANNNHVSMFDHAQSYISRIFHVSPALDEETDESKGVQTWSSQYTRNDNPVVMVGKESERGKPLLLPVRSLKNRVFEDEDENEQQPSTASASFARSSSLKKKKSYDLQEKEKPKDDIVLPSPIPWRSRSGRLEYSKEEQKPRLSRSQTLEPRVSDRFSPQNPLSLEPKKLKIGEDFVKKKSFSKSDPPPPSPPPPLPPRVPPVVGNPRNILRRKEVRKVQSGFEHRNPSDDDLPRKEVRTVQSGFEHRNPSDDDDLPRKEVRRVQSGFEHRNPSDDDLPRKEVRRVQSGFEHRNPSDDLPRKSVRTVRSGNFNSRVDDEPMDFEFIEKPKEEEKYDFFKELVSQSEEESEEENGGESNDGGGSSIGDGGPDVDKKADEFIAKFREQIRLQRIESIKRSSAEISKKVHR